MSILTSSGRRLGRHTEVMNAEDVRLSVVRALRATLFVSLSGDIGQDDSGIHDYTVLVKVRWSPDTGPDVDLDELSEMSHVDTQTYFPELIKSLPQSLEITVGEGSFVAADLSNPECLHLLAQRSMDLAIVGEALWGEHLDLQPLLSRYELANTRVLIANSMQIDPAWRGASYGLLATDLVIQRLRAGVALAALFPMGPGLTDLDERRASHERLMWYWAKIGFEPFEDIMVRPLVVT